MLLQDDVSGCEMSGTPRTDAIRIKYAGKLVAAINNSQAFDAIKEMVSASMSTMGKLELDLATANARISELEKELEDEANLKALAYSRHAEEKKRADEAESFLLTVIDFLRFAPLSSGICACGDSIEGHANAMNCGHSPVDSGEYNIMKLIERYEAMRHD